MIHLALVFIFVLAFNLHAQTYSVPRAMSLEKVSDRAFGNKWVTEQGYGGFNPEQFYPIGWSRDGKFAYYYEPVDDACGCYFARLMIQDMRTDKFVWEYKYDGSDNMDQKTGKMLPPTNMRQLWRMNKKLISQKLREHGIVAMRSTLLPKTFRVGGRTFTATDNVTMSTDQYDEDRVSKLSYTLSEKGLGTKTVFVANYTKHDYWPMHGATVLGVIKSPFEPRVAFVGMHVNRGWEGPPHTGDVHIVGADLTTGFRAANDPLLKYPWVWFVPVNDPNKPTWEVLPQEAKPGEVILSKRNELGLLSNFAATPFEIGERDRYASVEGLWQSMLYPEGPDDERAKDKRVTWKYTRDEVAMMTGFEAKEAGRLAEENMKILGIDWVTYKGNRFPYRSSTPGEHHRLILEAMRAKLEHNPPVKSVLLSTGDLILKPDHHPEPNAPPEWRYYEIWMQLRSELQKP